MKCPTFKRSYKRGIFYSKGQKEVSCLQKELQERYRIFKGAKGRAGYLQKKPQVGFPIVRRSYKSDAILSSKGATRGLSYVLKELLYRYFIFKLS